MFIEVGRSGWRTPAGCNVGHSHRSTVDLAHCTPLGCGPRDQVSINIAPRWGAARTDHVSINIAPLRGAYTN